MEKLENEWANALNDGDKVRVKITPNYSEFKTSRQFCY